MASTYVNDLRLNEMATGDASGSWGTVTNTNLELIGEAFSYGTETIGDADSTLTIADGAADAARSFYLKITSSVDLTTTRIVTLGPNTVSKVWMIENATTGSQVITIKQGSGATINVPNGQVKMISTDGAGSGGAVLDLLVDVDLTGTTTLVNLDVSGTLGVTGVLTATSLDISGDIDVDGTTNLDVVDIDGAVDMASTLLVTGVLTTTAATVSNGGGQFNGAITVGVDDTGYDVKFFGATTGKSLLWDESADSLIVTGTTTLVGTTNLDAVDIDGATQIDATVTVGVDDTGYDVKFFGATAGKYMLWDESADTLEVSGTVVAAAGTALLPSITTTGDLNTGMWFPAADTIAFSEGGVEALRIDSSNRFLVGCTAQPSSSVNGFGVLSTGILIGSVNSDKVAVFNRNTSDGEIVLFQKGGTTVGSIGSVSGATAYIDGGSGFSGIQFGGDGLAPRDNGALADNTSDLGTSSYRFKDLYLSGGVYLGGTVAANKLDDYEEGTWTPVITNGAGGATLGISVTSADYTKVGRMCTITAHITRSDATSLLLDMIITNLPFTQSGGAQTGGVIWLDNASTDYLGMCYANNGTVMYFRSFADVNAYIKTDQFNNGRSLYFSRTYQTT
jgi:hypothetical protein